MPGVSVTTVRNGARVLRRVQGIGPRGPAGFISSKADIGLAHVDDTSDLDKPISNAVAAALAAVDAAPVVYDPQWASTTEFLGDEVVTGVGANGNWYVDTDYPAAFPDISHILGVGQSNEPGAECATVRYNMPLGNIMFALGLKTWNVYTNAATPWRRPVASFAFVPLVEGVWDGFTGQSQATGMTLVLKTGGVGGRFAAADLSKAVPHFLYSYSCTGSQHLTELSQEDNRAIGASSSAQTLYGAPATNPQPGPGGYYNTAINDIIRARDWAKRLNLSYGLVAITLTHGEEDAGGQIYRGGAVLTWANFIPVYKAKLTSYVYGLMYDWREAGDHDRPVPVIINQVLDDWAGTAQWQLAEEDPNIFLVQPIYQYPSAINGIRNATTHGAVVHMTPDAHDGLGVKRGQALREIYAGRNWAPFRLVEVKRDTNTRILIKFKLARGPLQWETTLLPTALNYGFQVNLGTHDAVGAARTILDVSILEPNIVAVTLSPSTPVAAAAAAYVNYGLQLVQTPSIPGPTAVAAGAAAVYPGGSVATTDLTFAGDQRPIFNDMLKEGCFALRQIQGGGTAYNYVRSIRYTGGNTICNIENPSAYPGTVAFVTGTVCSVERDRSWGNLCDSDDFESPLTFQDPWGTRQGLPLFGVNFCPVIYRAIAT